MSEASHFDFEPFKDHIGLRYFFEISGANDPLKKVFRFVDHGVEDNENKKTEVKLSTLRIEISKMLSSFVQLCFENR